MTIKRSLDFIGTETAADNSSRLVEDKDAFLWRKIITFCKLFFPFMLKFEKLLSFSFVNWVDLSQSEIILLIDMPLLNSTLSTTLLLKQIMLEIYIQTSTNTPKSLSHVNASIHTFEKLPYIKPLTPFLRQFWDCDWKAKELKMSK